MLVVDENDDVFIGDKILRYFGNCLKCGLCCKMFNEIEITQEEIDHIACSLNLSRNDFLHKFTQATTKRHTPKKIFLKSPCPFQKSMKCTIHKRKPFDCKTYPLIVNRTKEQAVLSGIYLCPQATNFYQGFLDFCYHIFPSLYEELIALENESSWSSLGLELTLSADPLSQYIDWLYSQKKLKA